MARFILLLILAGIAVAAPAGRPRLPLAGHWQWQWLAAVDAEIDEGAWGKRPVTLPGTVRFKGDEHAAVVFARDIDVPGEWAGRRVVLNIGHPLFGLAATVNDRSAGEIPGYGGQLDITALVRPGETNRLVLRGFHRGEGLAELDAYAEATIPALGYEKDLAGILGLSDTVYLESQPQTAVVSDVWYRTFTRGRHRIEPQVTVTCERPVNNARLVVAVYEAEGDTEVQRREFAVGNLPTGESTHTVMVPAEKLTLWWPGDPYLYRGQVTLLDGDGSVVDRSEPTLFGVREIWIQGRRFFCNGHPVHFTLDAYYFTTRDRSLEEAFQAALDAGVTATYGKHGQIGTAIIHDNGPWAVLGDRLGMGILSYGVSVGYAGGDLTRPDVFAAYRTWAEAHLRRFRNHPSIFFWCLSTNYAVGSNEPTVVGRSEFMRYKHRGAVLASMVHRELDPTRPNFHHAGQGVGDFDSSNTYFNHLPRQEVEDWLSCWEESGDRPYVVVEFNGVPLYVDYIKHYTDPPLVSYITEYAARLAGDAAYVAETTEYRDYANYRVPRLNSHWDYAGPSYSDLVVDQLCKGMARVTRACRFRRVPTDLWIWAADPSRYESPDDPRLKNRQRLGNTAADLQAGLQFWIGGPGDDWTDKGHDFFAGETIGKSLLIIDDRRVWPYTRFGVVWEAAWVDSGEVLAAGDTREDGEITAPWYARLKVPIVFTAPDVDRPRDVRLAARLVDARGDRVFGEDSFALTVYPRRTAPAAPALTVFDPVGDTSAWLRDAGVDVRSWEAGGPVEGVLVIGRDALSEGDELPFTPADVVAGLRVFIFEQRAAALDRFGFRYEAHNPRQVFPRQTDHPLAAGLTADNLRDWRGASTLVPWGPERDGRGNSRRAHHWSNRGTVASTIIETPHFGTFRTICDAEFDLAYTPLLQWGHGKGEVVFCQLDITARTQTEPAAELVKHNVLRYAAATPTGPDARRTAVCTSPELAAKVAAWGFATAPWTDSPDPEAHVVVLDGKTPVPAAVAAFVAAGGEALVVGATEAALAGPLTDFALEPTARSGTVGPASDEPLLAGVGPQHLHWREPLGFDALVGQGDANVLLGGLLGVVRHGRGRFVILQLTDAMLDDPTVAQNADPTDEALSAAWHRKNRARTRWQANRFRAILLANLGVRSSADLIDGFFNPRRPLPFIAVDKWLYAGGLPPPATPAGDPADLDVAAVLGDRNAETPVALDDGREVPWHEPTDVNNGLGAGGYMNLAPVYGIEVRKRTVAVTHVWSSRDRRATLQIGADWWLQVRVNGEEVFRTGTIDGFNGRKHAKGFGFSVRAQLRRGWNEIVCVVGSGSAGNAFWFQLSNPGDVVVKPTLSAPQEEPWLFLRFAKGEGARRLSDEELAEAEEAAPSFALYTEPLTVRDDPYLFMRW